ncbi:hypothetical protein [Candidatus Filomicrobium marinum]|uniref:hypothetical protein n=1 Tax=Candidatus Filomicrobium marinum TaxID=1608628 RepID=UPI00062644E4|nr:hypothetical protein [Candidatus Filomicrobium marinum]
MVVSAVLNYRLGIRLGGQDEVERHLYGNGLAFWRADAMQVEHHLRGWGAGDVRPSADAGWRPSVT